MSLQDELRAERALTSQYEKALSEALQLAREQDATLQRQRQVIDDYEHLIETKVIPMAQYFLQQGQQHKPAVNAAEAK